MITITALLMTIVSFAQKPLFTKASIESARVYYNGAELVQTTSLNLPKGMSEVVVTNVANFLNENSIQVGAPAKVTIMSVQFTNAYIQEYDTAENTTLLKPVRDSIKLLEKELQQLLNTKATEQMTLQLLDKNQAVGGTNGFTVAELSKLVEYYKVKRTETSNNIDKLSEKEIVLKNKLQRLNSRLTINQDKEERQSQGKLILQIMNDAAGNIPLQITYLTHNARWAPFYDLRVEKVNSPIKMMYKAEVAQNTGVDWRNVKLSLTSGNANQNNQAPVLSPWFLDYYENYAVAADVDSYASEAVVYESASKRVSSRPNASFIQSLQGQVPGLAITNSTMDNFTALNESQLNISFDIDLPYTVLANGKKHSVALKDFEIPATYNYYSAPVSDLNAYLMTSIRDYGNYNLLEGEANVIFEGLYVGKTVIRPNNTEEEMKLIMGKDGKIAITRTLITDKSGTKTLSSRKIQNFVYEISVRNNKKESVEIKLEDLYPISSNKDIEIELTEKDGATVDAEKGLLTWKLNVKPNETKKVRFGYQIKSSKDKVVSY